MDAMLHISTLHYLVLGAALFLLGVIGVLTRRNVVIVLMSIELILNAVNLNLVAFSRLYGLHGQVFSIFVITDAAAEAAAEQFLESPGAFASAFSLMWIEVIHERRRNLPPGAGPAARLAARLPGHRLCRR